MRCTSLFVQLSLAGLIIFIGAVAQATAAPETAVDASSANAAREKAVAAGIDFLKTSQAADGSYSAQAGPAVTALVTTAILRNGRSIDDPQVAKSLKYLEGFVQPNGGICKPESNYKNYETCLAIVCFAAANKDGRYAKLLANAEKFVKGEQWDEGEGNDPANPNYGGAGYGGKKRPDLSNTSFLIDALKAAGRGPEDESIKKALVFVSRCQNLETEHNTTPFPAKNPDGGFYYTAAAGGDSMAGKTENGGLRSYASMTYAGLKSMIYAGLGPDDPRTKAAVSWLKKNYALDSNPGMGPAGLYYYYNTFAKTLDAVGQNEFVDADGNKHNWRQELIAALATRQQPNGSWVNETSRWLEGDPNLVTGYALLALSYCNKPKP